MKRGDMDPARGILWSVIAGALLWGAGFMSSAFAVEVQFATCTAELDVECTGGVFAYASAEEIVTDHLAVWTCRGGSAGPANYYDECDALGGDGAFRFVENIEPGDLWTGSASGAVDTFIEMDSLRSLLVVVNGGGGGEGGGGGDFDPADIDFDKAAGAFSVGFIAIAMFWGLGRGVGALLELVRRS